MISDFSTFFRLNSRRVRHSLTRRGVPSDLAADLTQEAFLRLLSAWPHGPLDASGMDNPSSYLRRIARNLAIDLGRRDRAAPFAPMSPDAVAAVVDAAPSPESALADRQKLALVARALDGLPERTRRAFELHRLEEMTIAEVGRELGLSTSRAGALVKEAYTRIRAEVRQSAG